MGHSLSPIAQQTALWHQLWSENHRGIQRFCGSWTRNESDRDELVQTVYLRAWTGLNHFRGESSARSWLYRIAGNAVRDFRRRRFHRDQVEPVGGEEERVASEFPDPERQVAARHRAAQVGQALSGLDPRDQELLLGRLVDGRSYEELATQLAMSECAARKRVSRARKKLEREVRA